MEEIKNCPHCGAEVEPGWDICWNCQNIIDVLPINETDNTDKKNSDSKKGFVKVNKQNIIDAGSQLKFLVVLYIITIPLGIATAIIESTGFYIFAAVCSIIIVILSLLSIYQTGKSLIQSVQNKDNSAIKEEFVKVNRQNIIDAGNQIKFLVIIYIISIPIGIAAAIINKTPFYIFAAICSIIVFILTVVNIYQIAQSLINSVQDVNNNEKDKNNYID